MTTMPEIVPGRCSVIVAGRQRCDEPATWSFVGTDGETRYYECARHSTQHVPVRGRARLGDTVMVHRNGREYPATVTRVGARGAVYATFRYDNGTEREVRV